MKKDKKNKNDKIRKISIIKMIIAVIFFLVGLILFVSILNLDLIPTKYLAIVGIVLIVIEAIVDLCLLSKKRWLNGISIALFIIFTLIFIVGIKYVNETDAFLDSSLNNAEEILDIDFYLLGNEEYTEEEITSGEVYYYNSTLFIDKALAELNKKYSVNVTELDDITTLFDCDMFLIDKTSYYLFIEELGYSADDYYLLYEFSIEYADEETNESEEATESEESKDNTSSNNDDYYNIYLGGYDFSGYRMDLNKIITINTSTNEILITNIHRFTYINIPAYNQKNTLSSTARYGVQNNVEALEELFGIDIDYYVSVDSTGLVSLVDAIGGIEYCSDQAFTTTHATVLGTYDDTNGEHVKIIKGCQHLNGIETLTVARERYAFKLGAVQRDENTTAIMLDILYQMRNPSNITRYSSILNAVSGLYTTTIPRSVLTDGVKKLLNGGWSIDTQTLSGTNGTNKVHFSNLSGAVNYPNSSSVTKCSNGIKSLAN